MFAEIAAINLSAPVSSAPNAVQREGDKQ